jgi:hypothetical protein
MSAELSRQRMGKQTLECVSAILEPFCSIAESVD